MTITIQAQADVPVQWDFRSQHRVADASQWTAPAALTARDGVFADLLAFEPPVPRDIDVTLKLNGIEFTVHIEGYWTLVGYQGEAILYGEWIRRML